jgi:glyoxylase-like metal-dependent hydrolase (beta-lactamase superfamily II)
VPLVFIDTPGHSDKGMCIELGGCLFTGDTILYRTQPLLKKKYGASKKDLRQSIEKIYRSYPGDTKVFPGHGELFMLKDTENYYNQYFNN